MADPASPSGGLDRLAAEIRDEAWDLAHALVAEGLAGDDMPTLPRVGQLGQLGDVPTFLSELGAQLAAPDPGRLREGSSLLALARDHARNREALGFAPREIVTEFLLLRRVLWRFVSARAAAFAADELLLVERRLNDAIDRLVTECVVAYFERATSELAHQARRDALTGLLNHQAFVEALDAELERAARYGHGLALVFFDVDRFKEVNDTLGHPEGDRVLRVVARALGDTLRRTDLAGRMGGDEFAAALVESDPEAAGTFVGRLVDRLDELAGAGELPAGFAVSPGVAHHPSEAADADGLFRVADRRLYEVKRARAGTGAP